MRARLYYEAHVTVEAGEDWDHFAESARVMGWRASKFDVDEVDDMSGKWFLSCRGEDLDEIRGYVGSMVADLEEVEMKVLRWKVEDTLLDSKHGDTLEVTA